MRSPRQAKLAGLLLHDFRRSTPRSMICGVPQKTAREIPGHKTDSVFSRYNSAGHPWHAARKN